MQPGLLPATVGRKPRRARGSGAGRAWQLLKVAWPPVNLALVLLLAARRALFAGPAGARYGGGCGLEEEACELDCSGHGKCWGGACRCEPGWGGRDCSERGCPNGCSGHGACRKGTCLCSRKWAGIDCSISVAELLVKETIEDLGAPYVGDGRIQAPDTEVFISSRGARRYPHLLCRTKACSATWISQLTQLAPYLPKESYKPSYKTCAVVSSGKTLVHVNGTVRREGHGELIDRHSAVFRLDNAPTKGFEKWVGQRTTHRIVQGDYAKMVQSILGTEIIKNQTKSVVMPTTWWQGGYPSVEKVTYILAVPGSAGNSQTRAPEHNGYMPFTELFPGNRKFLVSPIFMNEALDAYTKARAKVRDMGLGCYKEDSGHSDMKLSQLFLATLLSLQVCNKVSVFGLDIYEQAAKARVSRDRRFRARIRNMGSPSTRCCYYPEDEDYKPETKLCDEMSRRHAIRLLLQTKRLTVHS